MGDCQHLHLKRVEGVPPPETKFLGMPVYGYYCSKCHIPLLYVNLSDANATVNPSTGITMMKIKPALDEKH